MSVDQRNEIFKLLNKDDEFLESLKGTLNREQRKLMRKI